MSADGTGTPPPYALPDEGKVDAVKPYHVHTPFTPPASAVDGNISQTQAKQAHSQSSVQTNKFVSYETELGRNPGMTTCVTCQQQVLTNVQYKVGAYAWLMCILFILCGTFTTHAPGATRCSTWRRKVVVDPGLHPYLHYSNEDSSGLEKLKDTIIAAKRNITVFKGQGNKRKY